MKQKTKKPEEVKVVKVSGGESRYEYSQKIRFDDVEGVTRLLRTAANKFLISSNTSISSSIDYTDADVKIWGYNPGIKKADFIKVVRLLRKNYPLIEK